MSDSCDVATVLNGKGREMMRRLVRLDWALKRLLRSKANFCVLEGFLSELLHEDVEILELLESESNRDDEDDKQNRVDLKVKLGGGEIVIIEFQTSSDVFFLQRLLYSTSKVITEHMDSGDDYEEVTKVISVNVLFFDYGEGEDYLYHGTTNFVGVHKGDVLLQKTKSKRWKTGPNLWRIFPEYYLIKAKSFDDVARNTLDEWIYVLKNGDLPEGYSAKGLDEAKTILARMALSEADRVDYDHYMMAKWKRASEDETKFIEGMEKGREEGREHEKFGIAKSLLSKLSDQEIADATGLTVESIASLRAEVEELEPED